MVVPWPHRSRRKNACSALRISLHFLSLHAHCRMQCAGFSRENEREAMVDGARMRGINYRGEVQYISVTCSEFLSLMRSSRTLSFDVLL